MASPMRLNPELIAAAEREAVLQRRSTPKQIEFWALLGQAVQSVVDYSDIIAVTQGLKKINIEQVESKTVAADDVFADLEKTREKGNLSAKVTTAGIYYEASRSRPGLLDRVDTATGKRQTGQFQNGKFKVAP
jgi:hypothetical protein